MRNFLRRLWFSIAFMDVEFDTEDSISFDLFNVTAGGLNGIKFRGSLIMLYWEPALTIFGRREKGHFTWDFLYLRQIWD